MTEAGETAFQELLRENLAQYNPVNFRGDVGLAFLDWLAPAEALPLLQTQRHQVEIRLEEIRAIPGHAGSLQLIFSHQIRHLQAELDWLGEVIEQLSRK